MIPQSFHSNLNGGGAAVPIGSAKCDSGGMSKSPFAQGSIDAAQSGELVADLVRLKVFVKS